MLNHALSTYTCHVENRIATRHVELSGRICGCPKGVPGSFNHPHGWLTLRGRTVKNSIWLS